MSQIAQAIQNTHGIEGVAEFVRHLQRLDARVTAAYPDKPLPKLMLAGPGHELQHRLGAGFGRLEDGSPVVGIGDMAISRLTPAQMIAFIAHEYGHYYLPPTPNNYWSYSYYATKRIDECRADHFASRFIDNPLDLANALKSLRASSLQRANYNNDYTMRSWLEYAYLGGNTHPHTDTRHTALADLPRRHLPTESIRFNGDCTIRDITPPLASLPRLPELPAQGQPTPSRP